MIRRPPRSTLFPYTPLSRSVHHERAVAVDVHHEPVRVGGGDPHRRGQAVAHRAQPARGAPPPRVLELVVLCRDRKSTRLNSSHGYISYAVFCLKKKK